MLKYQAQTHDTNKQASLKKLVKNKEQKDHSQMDLDNSSSGVKRKEGENLKKDNKRDGLIGRLSCEEGKENKILHNNWIINNQVLKESTDKNQKNPSSKSVIVVKPNYALQPSDTNQRTSVRKAGSERKTEKEDNPQSIFIGYLEKFFGEEKTVFGERGRCSSVK